MAYPQISFPRTTFTVPSFIKQRREVVYSTTILYQLNVLKTTGRYDAFKLRWHDSYSDAPDVWPVPNHLFWDSDVAKWIEGACYFLQWRKNVEIETAVEELVAMIRGAQQEDGYLNIHFTVVEPGKRWTDFNGYNAGHLIEAALAHHECYGNELLMEPILKYVDLLCETFGPEKGQKHGYPGHPEIELALLRLYGKTGNSKHKQLASYFVEERGNATGQDGQHYYDVEAQNRDERPNERPGYWPSARCFWYQQAHLPIVEQPSIEGHSVRAMYLLTAVADLLRDDGGISQNRDGYETAVKRLWDNMVDRKMYLTGGIGSQKQWEGFGIDYFLPSSTDEGGCYAETCAAIGVMMLAERMLQIDLNSKYTDILELCFYNAVMTGMSADGKRFTYINQMASSDADLSKRAEWFTCACCPPNVTRLLGYIGGYLWTFEVAKREVAVNVHMYSSAVLSIPADDGVVEIEQKSDWPWDGRVEFEVRNTTSAMTTIKLRIPAWTDSWTISPEPPATAAVKGYLELPAEWVKRNPKFQLDISFKPRFVSPHPSTNQNIVALSRGPLVYCVEDIDNPWEEDHFKAIALDSSCKITEVQEKLLGGEEYVSLIAHDAAWRQAVKKTGPQLPQDAVAWERESRAKGLKFVPYCLRDNRGGGGHMRVGLRRKSQ